MRSLLEHKGAPASRHQTARHAAPEPLTTTHRFEAFRVLLGTLLTLVLTAFLTSAKLVEIADRMEFGPERDRWLHTAEIVHEASATLYLDKPGELIRSVVRYDEGPRNDGPIDDVVIGDLALAAETDAVIDPTPMEVEEPTVQILGMSPEPAPADPPIESEATETPPDPPQEPPSEIPALRQIDDSLPLRLWMGGDSLGQFMAAHIAYRIAPPDRTDIQIDYHISTGLARPDYFDWPARLTSVISGEDRPEAIVYMVGGNDDQAMKFQNTALEVSTPEWREEYRRRVGLMMDVTAYADTRLIWVLLPPMQEERREIISNEINTIVTEQAEQRPWVSVIDIDDLFVDDAGIYSQFVRDPSGEQQLARQADGVHITETGSRWVADRLWEEIVGLWDTVEAPTQTEPADVSPAPAEPIAVSPDE